MLFNPVHDEGKNERAADTRAEQQFDAAIGQRRGCQRVCAAVENTAGCRVEVRGPEEVGAARCRGRNCRDETATGPITTSTTSFHAQ